MTSTLAPPAPPQRIQRYRLWCPLTPDERGGHTAECYEPIPPDEIPNREES